MYKIKVNDSNRKEYEECPLAFQCNCNFGSCRPYVLFTNILLMGMFVFALLPVILVTENITSDPPSNTTNICSQITIPQKNVFLATSVCCLIFYTFVIMLFNATIFFEENITVQRILRVCTALIFLVHIALTIVQTVSFYDNCIDSSTKNRFLMPLVLYYVTITSSLQYVGTKLNEKEK
jgi:hypothetical protein